MTRKNRLPAKISQKGISPLVMSNTHHIQSIITHPFPMLMPGVMEK